MRLVDLHPQFISAGRDKTDVEGPKVHRQGIGVIFDCPCGKCGHLWYVAFHNPLDGGPPYDEQGPHWHRTGQTLESLTLSPSIHRSRGCGWHGYIRNGEIVNV